MNYGKIGFEYSRVGQMSGLRVFGVWLYRRIGQRWTLRPSFRFDS